MKIFSPQTKPVEQSEIDSLKVAISALSSQIESCQQIKSDFDKAWNSTEAKFHAYEAEERHTLEKRHKEMLEEKQWHETQWHETQSYYLSSALSSHYEKNYVPQLLATMEKYRDDFYSIIAKGKMPREQAKELAQHLHGLTYRLFFCGEFDAQCASQLYELSQKLTSCFKPAYSCRWVDKSWEHTRFRGQEWVTVTTSGYDDGQREAVEGFHYNRNSSQYRGGLQLYFYEKDNASGTIHSLHKAAHHDRETAENRLDMHVPYNVLCGNDLKYNHSMYPQIYSADLLNSTLGLIIAAVQDNLPAFECVWTNFVAPQLADERQKQAQKAGDFIAKHNLLFYAAEHGSVNVLDYLYRQGAGKQQMSSFLYGKNRETISLTPLGIAIHAGNTGLDKTLTQKTIELLIKVGESYNAKVTENWQETRGYYTQQRQVQRDKKTSLLEFDTTGILKACVSKTRKARDVTSQNSASKTQDYLLATNKQLLARIKELEEKVQQLTIENATIKANHGIIATSTAPQIPTPGLTMCRFFKVDQPGSCKRGDSCHFQHAGVPQQPG